MKLDIKLDIERGFSIFRKLRVHLQWVVLKGTASKNRELPDMTNKSNTPAKETDSCPLERDLPPAAKRALAEAEERRKLKALENKVLESERGGQEGPEPTRYGDWEKKGILSDF
jgi:hypothetical protein